MEIIKNMVKDKQEKIENLKSEINRLRTLLDENILLYGTKDKRVLSISKQLDKAINLFFRTI
ncbi:MAG: Spo0E family sporulation regulatory protein-aspartic acid phosphatase [Caloramator sp.]|nr:Spo0E family sporulation regulatory protein-aspartic acid phosphatase [Caloramator sp.]